MERVFEIKHFKSVDLIEISSLRKHVTVSIDQIDILIIMAH